LARSRFKEIVSGTVERNVRSMGVAPGRFRWFADSQARGRARTGCRRRGGRGHRDLVVDLPGHVQV